MRPPLNKFAICQSLNNDIQSVMANVIRSGIFFSFPVQLTLHQSCYFVCYSSAIKCGEAGGACSRFVATNTNKIHFQYLSCLSSTSFRPPSMREKTLEHVQWAVYALLCHDYTPYYALAMCVPCRVIPLSIGAQSWLGPCVSVQLNVSTTFVLCAPSGLRMGHQNTNIAKGHSELLNAATQ